MVAQTGAHTNNTSMNEQASGQNADRYVVCCMEEILNKNSCRRWTELLSGNNRGNILFCWSDCNWQKCPLFV